MMFEWDDDNIDHIAQHRVEPSEAEEAVLDRHRAPFPAHSGRYGTIGRTEDGRLLVVIAERCGLSWRVVTARDATPTERRAYRRQLR
jgi:uncharacterized protein